MLQTAPKMQIVQSLSRALQTYQDGVTALNAAFDGDEAFRAQVVAAVELVIAQEGRVIVTGVGKSGHIGRKIAATMASTGTPAYFVHPTEASHGDLGMIGVNDVVIAMSWSGETAELSAILQYTARFKVPLIAITSKADSTLALHATVPLVLPRLTEACGLGLAPTTSTLLQLTIGDALAIALLERRGFSATDFKVFHPGGKLGAQLRTVGELSHRGDQIPLARIGTPLSEAIITMSGKGFGVIGVIDPAGELIGVVTDGDLRRHMAPNLLEMTVDQVMSTKPKVVAPDHLASAALETMQSKAISVLFVTEERRPVGILHVHDLLRAGVA
ncbi:arabinose 5-phosphate isomerase KdsD [Pleomorphomonas sp. SM30]|uniref:Arabinose-5-phosphate isomerase n=2 Tax=Oharaeibacter diazotrophicus TaxID=1920512 RepID=A0A4R6R972_9HYPH|nr:arabinose-5-phosphate isomerase [Oharaeibacter diazotrophicus]BBE72643.1 arabinose 5-phosphate isomerase KdsD [Pleomorphomonas sp. SM30]GLS76677.1 arabinose-5-phosphate isomerase [Oharaeibacter diazotrophicus]